MGKKGANHIEMILSFVLFVGFVGAAFYFFSPANVGRLTDATIEYSFREITKNTTVNVQTFNFGITSPFAPQIIDVDPKVQLIPGKVSAHNLEGEDVSATKIIGSNLITLESDNWTRDRFVSVSVAEDLESDNSMLSAGLNDPNIYKLGSSIQKEIISLKRFLKLNQSYYEDYYGLKKLFNLPGRTNFGFTLEISDSNKIVAVRDKPKTSDVFSDTRKVDILLGDGRIELSDLTVEVW